MSRAFTKEADGADTFDDLPDRPISSYPNDVTAEGLVLIEAALERAHRDHADAQTKNDRAALAKAARDLRYWTSRRSTAQVIPPPVDKQHVHFGSTVTLERDDGRRQTFRIVGEDEADPAHGTLSHAAPLARALFGKSVGDVVTAGGGNAEIIEIA
jgi:transcription elongation GreA/GreB family factor